MSTNLDPRPMEIRAVERAGRLILQQDQQFGMSWQYEWIDVVELPAGSTVVPMRIYCEKHDERYPRGGKCSGCAADEAMRE